VGCGKRKAATRSRAAELYTGSLFRDHLRLATRLARGVDGAVVILSAKHGVLDLDTLVEPYDVKFSGLEPGARLRWMTDVAADLSRRTKQREPIIALVGGEYLVWRSLVARRVVAPLDGLTMGERRSVVSALCAADFGPLFGRAA
jgi:hypothetical protein